MSDIKITQKQENFCLAYIETGNASEAYRRAYNTSKMKTESINVKASELLSDVKVSVRVKELREEAEKRSEVTQDKVIKELANISFFDVRTLFDENGNLKNPTLLDESCGKAISSIKQTSRQIKVGEGDFELETTTEYKLNNKNTSIDQLSKILGYYEKDNDQKKPDLSGVSIYLPTNGRD